MAGFDKEREVIEKWFKDHWAPPSPYASAPIQFENVPFDPPADQTWVRLSIINGDSTRRAIGTPALRRHVGIVMVSCFGPGKQGTKIPRILADAVVDALEDQVAHVAGNEYIEFLDSSIRNVGLVENGAFLVSVATTYNRDE